MSPVRFDTHQKALMRYVVFLSVALGVLVLFSLIPESAWAQDALPTIEEIEQAARRGDASGTTDRSMHILSILFGEFGESPLTSINGATTLLGSLFFVFNAVLFVVGTAYIGYNMVVAVAVSANDGEVLGKRMSGVWIPIRMGLGIFGMVPAFSGFSLAQAIMLMIAILGIGMANMLTEKAVLSNQQLQVLIPPPGIAKVEKDTTIFDNELGNAIFAMHVCALAYNDSNDIAIPNVMYSNQARRGRNVAIINVKDGIREHPKSQASCGYAILNDPEFREGSSLGFRSSSVNYEAIKSIHQAIADQNLTQLQALNTNIGALAQVWYNQARDGDRAPDYPLDEVRHYVTMAADNVKNNVSTNISHQVAAEVGALNERAVKSMIEDGWMGIGSWYVAFAESNSAVQSAIAGGGITVSPPPEAAYEDAPSHIVNMLNMMTLAREQEKEAKGGECSFWGGFFPYEANADGSCARGQRITLSLVDTLVKDSGGTGMVNPIIASKNIGDWMLVASGTVIAVAFGSWVLDTVMPAKGLAIKAATKFGGQITDAISGGGGFASSIISTMLIAMLVLGFIFAIYIPFVPFITWFTALVTYFSSLIEGLIAAQVWAFTHLHSDGEGMGPKTERGYIYALNMLLRPGLMVLGFFISSAILTLMGTFFFQQLGPALTNVQGNTNTGPLIMAGVIILVMIVLVTSIQTIFNLIYEIPDRVISWFGHGIDSRFASGMDQRIEGQMQQASRWSAAAMLAGRGR